MAYILKSLLQRDGCGVCMTRGGDPSNPNGPNVKDPGDDAFADDATLSNSDANTTGARILFSIHMNGSSNPETDYTTTLFGTRQRRRQAQSATASFCARHASDAAPKGEKVHGARLAEMDAGAVRRAERRDHRGGIGVSSGRVTARARVLRGPEDFGQMRPGEVLVASITTPAWTPLFAMASAVVTDVGGPLSHGSIVAREYGIPAVMGTSVATRRIPSGQSIRVDGDAGTVTLLDGRRGRRAAGAGTRIQGTHSPERKSDCILCSGRRGGARGRCVVEKPEIGLS